jgi:hypothetical protein
MTQAPPAVVKIPTESPQPAPGKAAKPSGRAKVSRLRSRFVVNPRRTRCARSRRQARFRGPSSDGAGLRRMGSYVRVSLGFVVGRQARSMTLASAASRRISGTAESRR